MHKIALILILGFCFSTSFAQKSQSYQPKSMLYTRALELFDKEKYNASIEVFEEFKTLTTDKMATADANFYIAACKIKLTHSNAERQMLDFIDEHPYSSKLNLAYLLMSEFYFDNGKYRSSIRYYKEVELNGITKLEEQKLHFQYGYALFQSGKYAEAKQQFYPLTVKDDNSYYILANYYYGYVSYMNEDYDDALKTFKKIENSPSIPNTMMLYMAQIYYIKGDYDNSLIYCDKVSANSVVNKRDFLRGKNYYRKGEYNKAAIFFESSKYSTDSMQSAEIYEIGNTYYKSNNCSKAIPLFTIISNEGNAVAQAASYSLADCFVKVNQKDKAQSAFFEAQRTDFNMDIKEESMYNYAKLSYENGNTKTALNYFQKFLEGFPKSQKSDEVRGIMADIFLQTKDYKTAITTLESIKNKDNKLKETYQKVCLLEGKQQYLDKNDKLAESYFLKALTYKINASLLGETYYWLAESNYSNNDYNTSINYYNQALGSGADGKTQSLAHYGLGYAYFSKENYELAVQNFNKYKTLSASYSPNTEIFNDAVLRMGDAYFMLGATDKNNNTYYNAALNSYAYISSRNVKGADYALLQRGMIYGLLGQSEQKISTLKRIPTEYPKSYYIPDALYEAGLELSNLNRFREAERNFQYVLNDYKGTIYELKSHYSLGILYYNEERDKDALVKFKYVVKYYPGTRESAESIKVIEKIYSSMGNTDEYEDWVKSVPNYSKSEGYFDSIAYRAALNKYQDGNYTTAIQEFTKYINKYPNGSFKFEAYYYRATSFESMKLIPDAIKDYKFVADAGLTEFRNRSIERTAYLSKSIGDENTALIYFQKWETVVKNNSDLSKAVYEQMHIYHKNADIKNAKPKASQLIYIAEATTWMKAEANLIMGKGMIEDSLFNTANSYFRAVSSTNKNELGAEAKYWEAWCHYKNDSLEKCKATIIAFNKEFSGYDFWLGKSLILLSDYYMAKNDAFQAKSTLNSVIANFTDERILSEAREKLATIEKNDSRLNNIQNLAPGSGR